MHSYPSIPSVSLVIYSITIGSISTGSMAYTNQYVGFSILIICSK